MEECQGRELLAWRLLPALLLMKPELRIPDINIGVTQVE